MEGSPQQNFLCCNIIRSIFVDRLCLRGLRAEMLISCPQPMQSCFKQLLMIHLPCMIF